jgi:hypothetical protein
MQPRPTGSDRPRPTPPPTNGKESKTPGLSEPFPFRRIHRDRIPHVRDTFQPTARSNHFSQLLGGSSLFRAMCNATDR